MKPTLKTAVRLAVVLFAFWLGAILSLPVIANFWPLPKDAPFSFKAQHLPAITVGVVFAIYVWRRWDSKQPLTGPRRSTRGPRLVWLKMP